MRRERSSFVFSGTCCTKLEPSYSGQSHGEQYELTSTYYVGWKTILGYVDKGPINVDLPSFHTARSNGFFHMLAKSRTCDDVAKELTLLVDEGLDIFNEFLCLKGFGSERKSCVGIGLFTLSLAHGARFSLVEICDTVVDLLLKPRLFVSQDTDSWVVDEEEMGLIVTKLDSVPAPDSHL